MPGNNFLIVDTNILLVYLIGSFNPESISSCNRTRAYSSDDFQKISKIFSHFQNKVIVTPNTLTEVSNFLFKDYKVYAKDLIVQQTNTILQMDEEYVKKEVIFNNRHIVEIGVTDTALISLLDNPNYYLLTSDVTLNSLANFERPNQSTNYWNLVGDEWFNNFLAMTGQYINY